MKTRFRPVGALVLAPCMACALLLVYPSCASDRIWGVPADQFVDAFAAAPSDLLAAVDSNNLSQITQAGPEWPMVAALVSSHLGLVSLVDPLLAIGVESSQDPYKSMYAEALAEHRLNARQYVEAERVTRVMSERAPRDAYVLFLYLQSVYWQEKDDDVMEILDRLDSSDLSVLSPSQRRELDLIRAVADTRLGREGWKAEILRLFYELPLSDLHYRAYASLTRRAPGLAAFDENERTLMRSFALAADEQYLEAVEMLKYGNMLDTLDPSVVLLDSLGRIYLEAKRYAEGYRTLSRWSHDDDDLIRRQALFWTGRFARALGRPADARDRFAEALETTRRSTPSLATERIRWYVVDTSRTLSVTDGVEAAKKYANDNIQLWYYDDTYERLINAVVSQRAWNLIEPLGEAVYSGGSGYILGLYSHLVVALNDYGVLSGSFELLTRASAVLQDLWRVSGRTTGMRYYRLVASGNLVPWNMVSDDASQVVPDPDGVVDSPTPERVVLGRLLETGLYEIAYDWIRSADGPRRNAIGDGAIEKAAETLSDAGYYTEGMRLADMLLRDSNKPASVGLLKASFPRAFPQVIEPGAEHAGVPAALVYALVREESYFNPKAMSPAGAIGLSQLMPATAEDMAGRMGIRAYDLTRPEDNLTIGIEYIAYCIRLFDSEFYGLLAYNAGLGRVRRWRDEYGDLPLPVLLEAVPIDETRLYLRKVATSMKYYEYLYPEIASGAELPILLPSLGGKP